MKATMLITLLFSAISCTTTPSRNIASFSEIKISNDLLTETQRYYDFLNNPKLFNEQTCSESLNTIYTQLFSLPALYFDHTKLHEDANEVLSLLWKSRVLLHSKLQEFDSKGSLSPSCVQSIRKAYRASRFLEDFAADFATQKRWSEPKIFSKPFPWTMVNEDFMAKEDFDFKNDLQSGDVLLWRGSSSVSAAIARIGVEDANFSHLSMIYKDEDTGKIYHMESLIETGAMYYEENDLLKKNTARLVLYRHKDPKIAKKAASKLFDWLKKNEVKVRKFHDKTIHTTKFLYDYAFDISEHEYIFCSELVHIGFKMATNDELKIPKFISQFKKTPNFLRKLGTTATKGFQPGDIELDPRFDIIAEWRDINEVYDNQIKDIIASKMYDWMEHKGYHFKKNALSVIISNFGYYMIRSPLAFLVDDMVAKNISKETAAMVYLMDKVSNKIFKSVQYINQEHMKKYGIAMTASDIYKEVEKIRLEDEEIYNGYLDAKKKYLPAIMPEKDRPKDESVFHNIFSP